MMMAYRGVAQTGGAKLEIFRNSLWNEIKKLDNNMKMSKKHQKACTSD